MKTLRKALCSGVLTGPFNWESDGFYTIYPNQLMPMTYTHKYSI